MDVKVVHQQANTIEVTFTVSHPSKQNSINWTSSEYLCGVVFLQFKIISDRCLSYNGEIAFNVFFFGQINKVVDNNLTYAFKVREKVIQTEITFHDANVWHQIHNNLQKVNRDPFTYVLEFSMSVDIVLGISSIKSLYEDADTTDFELRGENGSVKVHKLILMNFSPVLKTMLIGKWKESTTGTVDIARMSMETLEHFKRYMYLDEMPDTGLEQLLLLGSYYMMPDLVLKCSVKLLTKLNSGNLVELAEFAAKYEAKHLFMGILTVMQSKAINVVDLNVIKFNDVFVAP